MGRTKKDTNIESTGGTVETSRNTTKEKTVYDGLHEVAVSLNNIATAINNNSENTKHVGDKINRLCNVIKGTSNYVAYSNSRVWDA